MTERKSNYAEFWPYYSAGARQIEHPLSPLYGNRRRDHFLVQLFAEHPLAVAAYRVDLRLFLRLGWPLFR